MRSRFFSLAAHFYAPKVLAYSDLILYSKEINQSYLYNSLQKYANSDKLIGLLERLGAPEDVKQFILSLPPKFQGFAVGQLNKNKAITKIELENFIKQVVAKEELKEKTKTDIEEQFPLETPHEIRPWLVIQIKKYPNLKDTLIQHAKAIANFIISHDQEISSYTAPDMLETLEEQKMLTQESGPPTYNSPLLHFFGQVQNKERETIHVKSHILQFWFSKNFLRIRKEWKNNIEKVMKKDDKSFEQLISEAKNLYDAQQRGDLRGQEMPHSPLHNAEHASLLINFENINDWFTAITNEDKDFDIRKISPSDAIKFSKQWHQDEANKGAGRQYDPINRANIVYGPSNWKNEEYNGHFILELKSDNDLKVEGFKMNHCVGGYCSQVKSGRSRIFSLRNVGAPKTPIITIETDGSAALIRQDYGAGNSKIESIYHDMVNEWNIGKQDDMDVDKLDAWELRSLIHNGRLSNANFQKLVKHKDYNIRETLVSSPKTPPDILKQLVNDGSREVRFRLAENINLPEESMIIMTQDQETGIRSSLASNKNITPTIIETLSNDASKEVRANIAKREDISLDIIKKLVNDSDSEGYILTEILLNKMVPKEIKESIDPSKLSVRYISTLNENDELTEDLVDKLVMSNNVKMRTYIAGASAEFNGGKFPLSPTSLNKLINDPADEVRYKLVKTVKLSPEAIKHLSNDTSEDVISALLSHQDIDVETIRKIDAERIDPVNGTKVGVLEHKMALNDSTPADVLKKLYDVADNYNPDNNLLKNDRDFSQYKYSLMGDLLKNKNLPVELIKDAFENDKGEKANYAENPNTPSEILQKIYLSSNRSFNLELTKLLAKNPNTPVAILRELFETDERSFSKELIENHNTPSSILKKLYNINSSYHYNYSGGDEDRGSNDDRFKYNPNTPSNILESLYQKGKARHGGSYDHFETFAKNKGSPSKILQDIYDSLAEYNVLTGDGHIFDGEDIKTLLLLLSKNPGTPSEILKKIYTADVGIATVGDKALRLEALPNLALNIATPISILKELAKAKDPAISRHAQETLIRVSQLRKERTRPQYMKRRAPIDVDQISPEDIDTYWPWGNDIPEREPTLDDGHPELEADEHSPPSSARW